MGKEGSERGKESPENGNVKVVVRVRPITQKELEALETPVIEADENRNELNVSMSAKRASQCKSYPFDNVFGPTTTQQHLFETVCRPVVDEVLQGYNCTIFAYGQTGTGKTFTMEGLSKSKKAIHFNAGTGGQINFSAFQMLFASICELLFFTQASFLDRSKLFLSI